VLRESLITSPRRVVRLRLEETAFRCGGRLNIYIFSKHCRRPTRGGPPTRVVCGRKTFSPYITGMLRNVTRSLLELVLII
jgi:hypothetical protein